LATEALQETRTRMRVDLGRRCTRTSRRRPPPVVVPLPTRTSNSSSSNSRAGNQTGVKTGSSTCLKSSSRECTSSSGAEHNSSSIAETTTRVGKTSSRRTITRGPPLLNSRPRTNKPSNVQGRVNSQMPTSRSNTPTKGGPTKTKEDLSRTALISSRSPSNKLCRRLPSPLLMASQLQCSNPHNLSSISPCLTLRQHHSRCHRCRCPSLRETRPRCPRHQLAPSRCRPLP